MAIGTKVQFLWSSEIIIQCTEDKDKLSAFAAQLLCIGTFILNTFSTPEGK